MKFLGKYSKSIYNFYRKRLQNVSFEHILKKSLLLLEPGVRDEIKAFITSKIVKESGFVGRDNKPDIYYTLFGYFLSEALDVSVTLLSIKQFIKSLVHSAGLSGVHLFCEAILYSKIVGNDKQTNLLKKKVIDELKFIEKKQVEYHVFFGVLALYYLNEFSLIRSFIKKNIQQIRHIDTSMPCSVLAAKAILLKLVGEPVEKAVKSIELFYREKRGFVALQHSPIEDLLSTSVALYALHVAGYDLKIIKHDCLAYIDSLYTNGGFRATEYDDVTDIEYTFYGLLALGVLSMNNQ